MTMIQTAPGFLRFENGNQARVVHVSPHSSARKTAQRLGFVEAAPVIFMMGGASNMSAEAITWTRSLVEDGIARFAAKHGAVIVDGGTNAGIMQMMGRARRKYRGMFPLVGCAPQGKVSYPGQASVRRLSKTALEPHHSHFALVDADYWGAESDMVVGLARAIAADKRPVLGVLVNGGKIAQYEVYIASARGRSALPVLVIDGSGRTADTIAAAARTRTTSSAMMRTIIESGKIGLFPMEAGAGALYRKLARLFV